MANVVRIKNKMTSEVRDVDLESQEWEELRVEVTPSGFPKWEQVAHHQANALLDRAEDGELLAEDLGEEAAAELLAARRHDGNIIGPERYPEQAITEAEREAGIESWEQKKQQLAEHGPQDPNKVRKVLTEAAETVADSSPRKRRGSRSSGSRSSSGSGGSSSGSSGGSGSGDGS